MPKGKWQGKLEGMKLCGGVSPTWPARPRSASIRASSCPTARGTPSGSRACSASPIPASMRWNGRPRRRVRGLAIRGDRWCADADRTCSPAGRAGRSNRGQGRLAGGGRVQAACAATWATVTAWASSNRAAHYIDGYVDFGREIETRAVRLRVVEQWADKGQAGCMGIRVDLGGGTLDAEALPRVRRGCAEISRRRAARSTRWPRSAIEVYNTRQRQAARGNRDCPARPTGRRPRRRTAGDLRRPGGARRSEAGKAHQALVSDLESTRRPGRWTRGPHVCVRRRARPVMARQRARLRSSGEVPAHPSASRAASGSAPGTRPVWAASPAIERRPPRPALGGGEPVLAEAHHALGQRRHVQERVPGQHGLWRRRRARSRGQEPRCSTPAWNSRSTGGRPVRI